MGGRRGALGLAVSALVLAFDVESTGGGVAATLHGLPGTALGTSVGAAVFLVTVGLGLAAVVAPFSVAGQASEPDVKRPLRLGCSPVSSWAQIHPELRSSRTRPPTGTRSASASASTGCLGLPGHCGEGKGRTLEDLGESRPGLGRGLLPAQLGDRSPSKTSPVTSASSILSTKSTTQS